MSNEPTSREREQGPMAAPATASQTPSHPAVGEISVETLKDKVSEDVESVTGAVRQGADMAIEKVRGTVSQQKNFVANQVGGIASVLEKVGSELEGSDQSEIGRYARQMGKSVQRIAKDLEGKDLGAVATMAEDFGRKQPLAFLSAAALAGLAASRFLTATANRSTKVGKGEAASERTITKEGRPNG